MPASAVSHPQSANRNNLLNMLAIHSSLLQVALQDNDKRLVARVMHYLPQVRRKLDGSSLLFIINQSTSGNGFVARLSEILSALDGGTAIQSNEKFTLNNVNEAYFCFLGAIYLMDRSRLFEAEYSFEQTIDFIESANLRLLDPLLARAFYFYGRSQEILEKLALSHNRLMIAFRQSSLRHDMETHATIYNILLRLLILSNQLEMAQKLVNKSNFPDFVAGANQARFHYYLAFIQATQANYSSAKDNLLHALRKVPHGKMAVGFVQTINKLMVVTELLLGEIPERSLFRQPMLVKSLLPYFDLTQSVRLGDLGRFQETIEKLQSKFATDKTLVFVQRLHQNVLKAGIKRLNKAYSRIPLSDVQSKLCLTSVEDAVFVLMKAIKDGVIEGEIDHSGGFLRSKTTSTPYYTNKPQEKFQDRITELNVLHNECFRSMRYNLVGTKKSSQENSNISTEAEMIEEYLDAGDFI